MLPVTGAFVVAALVLSAAASPAAAHPATADATVVTHWNAIAARTIVTENATPVPTSNLYFAFASLAVHDAVVTVDGRYEPYIRQQRARGKASAEAAAATAAYDVLRHYFPASATNLAADNASTLAGIPDGSAKERGIAVGARAAANIIRVRTGDGIGAPVTLDVVPAPGVWRPTPPGFAPMLAPWLGFVRPLGLRSPTQIRLPGPDALGSARYARDYNEVKAFGAATGSARTDAQTEAALFWNSNAAFQYQEALRVQVTRRGYDIVAAARAFALLGASMADAAISCWRAKYDYAYWRPVTAIPLADTDGNTATLPDATWAPLVVTPPYPEYTSGHACLSGAASEVYGYLFGRRAIDLDVSSTVAPPATRHFATAAALDQETMNARIWLGLHFRRAMTDGNRIGHRSANWMIDHYLRRT